MRFWAPLALLSAAAMTATAAERAAISGNVTDAAGKPLERATVMVYYAGVKHGYSAFCPSCYADCGKRTLTDASGGFTIRSLDPDLWFTLLMAEDGYTPEFVEKIDPAAGVHRIAALRPRARVDDPARVVRGRVVDAHDRPVRDAIVQPLLLPRFKRNGFCVTSSETSPLSIYNLREPRINSNLDRQVEGPQSSGFPTRRYPWKFWLGLYGRTVKGPGGFQSRGRWGE